MNIVELHKDRMQDSFSKDFLWVLPSVPSRRKEIATVR